MWKCVALLVLAAGLESKRASSAEPEVADLRQMIAKIESFESDQGYQAGVRQVFQVVLPLSDKSSLPILVRPSLGAGANQWEIEPVCLFGEFRACEDGGAEVIVQLAPNELLRFVGLSVDGLFRVDPATVLNRAVAPQLDSLEVVLSDDREPIGSFAVDRPGTRFEARINRGFDVERANRALARGSLHASMAYLRMAGETSFANSTGSSSVGERQTDRTVQQFDTKIFIGARGEAEARANVSQLVTQAFHLSGEDAPKLLPILAEGVIAEALSTKVVSVDWLRENVKKDRLAELNALIDASTRELTVTNTTQGSKSSEDVATKSDSVSGGIPLIVSSDSANTVSKGAVHSEGETDTISTRSKSLSEKEIRVTVVNGAAITRSLSVFHAAALSGSTRLTQFRGNPHCLPIKAVVAAAKAEVDRMQEIVAVRAEIADLTEKLVVARNEIFSWLENDYLNHQTSAQALIAAVRDERDKAFPAIHGQMMYSLISHGLAINNRALVAHQEEWFNGACDGKPELSRRQAWDEIFEPLHDTARAEVDRLIIVVGKTDENEFGRKLLADFDAKVKRLEALTARLLVLVSR